MSTKMIFIFRLFFLIILFANFTFCIQNGGTAPDTEARNHNMIKFSAEDAIVALPEATNENRKVFEGYQPNIALAEQQQQHTVHSPKQTSADHVLVQGKYSQHSTASRQSENPLNSIYNTGENYQSSSNYYNRPPSSNYNRPYGGQYDRDNIADNYQSYHDKPNYFQNNYAHNYNYPGNKRPNYNHRATPPPPPRDYPYEHQYYQNARPTPPYPYPYPNPEQQQSPNDYPSYAGLFNNFQAFPNPLSSLFGMFGNSGKPSNPLGSQISKALEDISANDDLNCVPKLLCTMAGNPERRAELPGFLTAPAITSLIAALPASSPVLVFGRAALLGFTGGEESCTTTYDKCPGNEDDLLYYLNNHRGGFFRFFNGGGSFNEVSSNFQDPSSLHTGSRPQSSNYGTNQGSGSGNGLNLLGTLASFFMPSLQSSNTGSDGLVSMVGNLLGGLLVPQRTKSTTRTKRSVDTIEALDNTDSSNTTANTKNSAEESETKVSETGDVTEESVEGRILNYKSGILSDSNNNYEPPVKFPFDDQTNYADNYRYGKEFDFKDYKSPNQAYVKYPNNYDADDRPYRGGKQISFKDDDNTGSGNYYSHQEDNRYDDQIRRPHHTKMIFPDRTGTGNLRFDSAELQSASDRDRDYNRQDVDYTRYRDDRDRDQNSNRDRYRVDRDRDQDSNRDRYQDDDRDYNRDRYGKILTKPSYSKYDTYYDYDEFYNNKRKPNYSSNSHKNDYHNSNRYDYTTTRRPSYNRYETTRRPSYNDDYYGTQHTNRYTSTYSSSSRPSGGEGNVYIANAKGVVEYYIKPNGQKVYV